MNVWGSEMAVVIAVIVLAVISPGPDFAIIVRNGLLYGRKNGLFTALGIASGISVHISYTLLGLGYAVAKSAWLLEAAKYLGAAYLVYLGCVSIYSSFKNSSVKASVEIAKNCLLKDTNYSNFAAYKNGFLCNALNPKTAMFFLALFTQVISPSTPKSVQIGIGIFISGIHLLWFSLVVLLLTNSKSSKIVAKSKAWIERVVGGSLIGLGTKVVCDI